MKIAVITLALHTNYGGILQAYALQRVLKKMGHEAILIDRIYHSHMPLWRLPLAYIKRCIKKYILGYNIRIFQESYDKQVWPVKTRHTAAFINRHIARICVKKISELKPVFDVIIVGSDQIWRPMCVGFPGFKNVFLDFAKKWNIKRIAYAASFGASQWEYTPKQTRIAQKLLQMFDAISIREDIGVDFCMRYLHQNATHTLDPTMLLDINEYKELYSDPYNSHTPKKELVSYILDPGHHTHQIIVKIIERTGWSHIECNSRVEDDTAPIEERIQPPVEEWLYNIQNSTYIFTDSFHACVFAILFHKPFIVWKNTTRGTARIDSLLKMFGLEDRCISSHQLGEIDKILSTNIDYIDIECRLQEFRKKSTLFITSALEG